jgi:hypothetical protein
MGNKGSFKKSNTPWNKDKKGIHLSPETEFKKDQNVGEKHPSWKGGVQKPKNDCAYLHAGNSQRVRRPKTIWEKANGPVPKGYIIYHKDGDNKNDDLSNLEIITRAELLKRNQRNSS